MPKWTLAKSERKDHAADDTETVAYEATVHLDADDPDALPTLADIGALVDALTTVDGIPATAKLGTTIDVALRWTDDDLA
jgi:hypothetical protein